MNGVDDEEDDEDEDKDKENSFIFRRAATKRKWKVVAVSSDDSVKRCCWELRTHAIIRRVIGSTSQTVIYKVIIYA